MNSSASDNLSPIKAAGPIGIFDSGVGGLSVLRHIATQLPNEDLIYFADSGFAPYGDKPEEFVIERSFRITDFLLKQNIKALVVACNTATAITIHLLREKYPDLPIVGVEPGLKPAAAKTITGTVGVMATERTLASNKFHVLHQLLNDQTGVHFIMQPCNGMADLIEHAELDSEPIFELVRRYLVPLLEQKADTIVLGCTHFNYFKESYQEIFPNKIEFVDGNEGALRELIRRMEKECDTISVKNGANDAKEFSKTDRVTYYFSGKQISAADQIRIDKYMCQLDRMALI